MKLENANTILSRLKKGHHVFVKEYPESTAFLKDLDLVKIYRNKVLLTKKGNLAAGMGIKDFLEYNRTETEILNFSIEKSRRKNRFLIVAFIVLLLLFIAGVLSDLSFSGIS